MTSLFFFFFNDTAPPEISPLPLHAALPTPSTSTCPATAATPCVTRAGCSSGSRGFTPNAKLRTCRYETTAPAMRPLRTLVVVHASLVPPESLEGHSDKEIEEWRTEYDVTATLRDLGTDARCVGVLDSC